VLEGACGRVEIMLKFWSLILFQFTIDYCFRSHYYFPPQRTFVKRVGYFTEIWNILNHILLWYMWINILRMCHLPNLTTVVTLLYIINLFLILNDVWCTYPPHWEDLLCKWVVLAVIRTHLWVFVVSSFAYVCLCVCIYVRIYVVCVFVFTHKLTHIFS
jgi:hypothetical protein